MNSWVQNSLSPVLAVDRAQYLTAERNGLSLQRQQRPDGSPVTVVVLTVRIDHFVLYSQETIYLRNQLRVAKRRCFWTHPLHRCHPCIYARHVGTTGTSARECVQPTFGYRAIVHETARGRLFIRLFLRCLHLRARAAAVIRISAILCFLLRCRRSRTFLRLLD